MAFTFQIDKSGPVTTLSMAGKLVDKVEAVEVSVEIEEELNEGTSRFVIDLSELEYMNSTGLNILINMMNRTRNEGGEAVIIGATPRIKSLFAVTKLDSVFTMKASKADALAHFNEMSQNK